MSQYSFTEYFEHEVLRKRPYLKKEWCIQVLQNPLRSEPQEKNRYRFWGKIEELEGRILRVITLDDKVTIHNAFRIQAMKLNYSITMRTRTRFISTFLSGRALKAARSRRVLFLIMMPQGTWWA